MGVYLLFFTFALVVVVVLILCAPLEEEPCLTMFLALTAPSKGLNVVGMP